jgi:hypothetical protein
VHKVCQGELLAKRSGFLDIALRNMKNKRIVVSYLNQNGNGEYKNG